MTALMICCKEGHSNAVTSLLKFKHNELDADGHSPNGDTALILATRGGHVDIVKQLIDRVRMPAAVNNLGVNAFFIACSLGFKSIVEILLTRNVVRQNAHVLGPAGVAPVHMAALNGHTDIVMKVLLCIKEKNPKTASGRTVLHVAMAAGHREVVKAIIPMLDNFLEIDANGQTPIAAAVANKHYDLARLVINEMLSRFDIPEGEKVYINRMMMQMVCMYCTFSNLNMIHF